MYRAHDERLDREVAIKLLPADFGNDEDRLRRFEQKAKATSALNHPNILTVYDIGEHEGAPGSSRSRKREVTGRRTRRIRYRSSIRRVECRTA